MKKHTLLAALIAVAVAYNSASPAQCAQDSVGQTPVTWFAPTPLTEKTTILTLDAYEARAGQIAIADVLSYSGGLISITAPEGWTRIQDNSSLSTRQSLYWHAVGPIDEREPVWIFSEPVDAQGAIVLLDGVDASDPIDASSGYVTLGPATAKSVATTGDGDFVMSFFASDFGVAGLDPQMPADLNVIVSPDMATHQYWILGAYQSDHGDTADAVSASSQCFNFAGAQVAFKPAAAR